MEARKRSSIRIKEKRAIGKVTAMAMEMEMRFAMLLLTMMVIIFKGVFDCDGHGDGDCDSVSGDDDVDELVTAISGPQGQFRADKNINYIDA